MFALVWALGFAVYWAVFRSTEKAFDDQVPVPAGDFVFQDGKTVKLPEFSIDKYEVTVGQYAKFLSFLEKHPNDATKFDHPKQPPALKHKPRTGIFTLAARSGASR